MSTLITESGNTIKLETIAGLSAASSLNDISVVTINKEEFDTDPITRDWLLGTDWVYDSVNNRVKIA